MTPDKIAPLLGFSAGLALAFAAVTLFCLLMWTLVPFTMLSLRRQSKEQLEVLRRIEERLAGNLPPAPAALPPPAVPGTQPNPANVN